MKKSDLKTGMRVRNRINEIYLVLKDVETKTYGHQDIVFVRNYEFLIGSKYREDLTATIDSDYDIIEVYEVEYNIAFNSNVLDLEERYSIWKRQEYTSEQKEIFKALKILGYKYIARDSDCSIYTFESIPEKCIGNWHSIDDNCVGLETDKILKTPHLNFINWEDEEPFEIPVV